MLPYITITFIPIITFCLEWSKEIKNSHKRFTMMFLAICYILFSALRWECGTDWEQFYGLFYSFNDVPFTEVFNHRYNWTTDSSTGGKIYEPGYALMNWLFVNTTGSFNAMLIFYTTIIIFIYYKLSWLYASKYPIYLFTFFITADFFYWRAGFASAICFFSIQYIISRKFLKFLLCCLVATSMHNSAILFLPFYFVLNRKFSNGLLISSFLFCSFIGSTSILYGIVEYVANILSTFRSEFGLISKLVLYLYTNSDNSIAKLIMSIFKYGIFIVIFCLYKKYFKIESERSDATKNNTDYFKFNKSDIYNVMLTSYVIGSCIWLLFRSQLTIFARMAIYFTGSFPVLNVMVLSILPSNKRKIFFGFVILNVFYIAFAKFLTFEELLIPYKTVFN